MRRPRGHHVVAEYRARAGIVKCSCGEIIVEPDEALINAAFQRHRWKNGEKRAASMSDGLSWADL